MGDERGWANYYFFVPGVLKLLGALSPSRTFGLPSGNALIPYFASGHHIDVFLPFVPLVSTVPVGCSSALAP